MESSIKQEIVEEKGIASSLDITFRSSVTSEFPYSMLFWVKAFIKVFDSIRKEHMHKLLHILDS